MKLRFLSLILALAGCSSTIELPVPQGLEAQQIAFGPSGAVELSWHLVLRTDEYLVHYDTDAAVEPYEGSGLSLVRWPAGCGDFDGGVVPDLAGPRDAGPDGLAPTDAAPTDARWPGVASDSPVGIPSTWCLDREESFTDAGEVPVLTPGKRPRIRLNGLEPGRTYFFAIQARRRQSLSPLSQPVTLLVSGVKP